MQLYYLRFVSVVLAIFRPKRTGGQIVWWIALWKALWCEKYWFFQESLKQPPEWLPLPLQTSTPQEPNAVGSPRAWFESVFLLIRAHANQLQFCMPYKRTLFELPASIAVLIFSAMIPYSLRKIPCGPVKEVETGMGFAASGRILSQSNKAVLMNMFISEHVRYLEWLRKASSCVTPSWSAWSALCPASINEAGPRVGSPCVFADFAVSGLRGVRHLGLRIIKPQDNLSTYILP